MDCGPATLHSLLRGFGRQVGYGRLREACQTSVDGTAIGALEDLATALGLGVEQVMLPLDHLLIPSCRAFPSLVVVAPSGVTHFVIAWRRHGARLQVMDPAVGRRWPSARAFLQEVYLHHHPIAVPDWRSWVETDEFTAALRHRIARLGGTPEDTDRLLRSAIAQPGWRGTAALDAAVRLTERFASTGAVRRRGPAISLVDRLAEEAAEAEGDTAVVPERFWTVRPTESDEDELTLRGAVLLRVTGLDPDPTDRDARDALPPQLGAILAHREPSLTSTILSALEPRGRVIAGLLAAATTASALLVTLEALLLNGLVQAGGRLAGTGQIQGALAILLAVAAALGLLELVSATGIRRLGRHLEARLRIAFLEKIPRLGDRWFRSRLPSDMAERAHSLALLRTLPAAGLGILGAGSELAATTIALAVLFPGTALFAVLGATTATLIPLALVPFLTERELRMRNHSAALGRLQLDSMLGLLAVRSHGAEPALGRLHEEILRRWRTSGHDQLRGWLVATTLQSLAGNGVAVALVVLHVSRHGAESGVLLLAYWALKLPELGSALAAGLAELPRLRSIAVRLAEPLGAPEEEAPDVGPAAASRGSGVSVRLRDVSVTGSGGPILEQLDLEIAAGSHVAIVGPSGAGKSTLVGLVLGWRRPTTGILEVDGDVLDARLVAHLRRDSVWIDPAVKLWNRPLLHNLRYGNADPSAALSDVLEAADLRGVVERLPEGLATPLGENGGTVSGGEGQRIRLGRGLGRGATRLVLLDEAFRGLDFAARRTLLETTRKRWPAATLLCVTHDAEAVHDFDRVLVLENGRVVEDGLPSALLDRKDSRFAKLVSSSRRPWNRRTWRRLVLRSDGISPAEGGPP